MSNGGPHDKWDKFPSAELSSDDVLAIVNAANETGEKPYTTAFVKQCTDGEFIFAGRYGRSG